MKDKMARLRAMKGKKKMVAGALYPAGYGI